jgi:hypothetical protein
VLAPGRTAARRAAVALSAIGGVLLVDAFATRRSAGKSRRCRRRTEVVAIERSLEDLHRVCREGTEARQTCDRLQRLGTLEFSSAPDGRGTVARIEFETASAAAAIAAPVAELFGKAPGQIVKRDLRRLKQLLEVGWVVESDASLRPGPHPARPARGPRAPLALAPNAEVRP